MVRNVSLKKEIEDILENARLSKNLCVSERINEQGFKCTYSFPGNMREELMRRASRSKRQQPQYKGGEYTQKGLALLEKNREAIQVLFDIRYLMEKHGYDVQNACKVLFKDKKALPAGFCRKSIREYYMGSVWYTKYCFEAAGKQWHSLERLIDLLPMLPKAWLEGIEITA